ncbi:hypothetical protein [Embleya sp. NBC_00896]|uniref:hypothetical protein n=1 Tax=Embleya sp. NBC_00896 TaxID=2975961 RepID=UPI002F915DB5|nr:hypothetical protein OG928_45160 [Embleya sp. NBC_00896]
MTTPNEEFTDADRDQLAVLLHKYAQYGLDQWTALRTSTTHGTVYIAITRDPQDGATDEDYHSIDRFVPGPTTRSENTHQNR